MYEVVLYKKYLMRDIVKMVLATLATHFYRATSIIRLTDVEKWDTAALVTLDGALKEYLGTTNGAECLCAGT